jgi:Lipocalin-like domain
MKNLFIIPLVMLLFLSCSNSSDDETPTQEITLIGKWQLIEIKYSNGGASPPWSSILGGYELTLNSNNTFTSTQLTGSGCTIGTYSVLNNKITLNYACGGGTTITKEFSQLSLTKSELVIKDDSCFEECADKLKRIN